MNRFIYFDDLVANALIQKIEHMHVRSVSLSELENYGERLVEWWTRNRNIRITVLTSYYYINKLFYDYPDYFSRYFDDKGELFIHLQEDKKAEDLRRKFRSYLSVDMLLSFIQSFIKE